jgi:hypothetical protein
MYPVPSGRHGKQPARSGEPTTNSRANSSRLPTSCERGYRRGCLRLTGGQSRGSHDELSFLFVVGSS